LRGTVSITELQEKVRAFCEARDWDQFHRPKDVAIGIATEAAELLAHFRFLSGEEAQNLLADPEKRERVEDELADVLFFVLRFAQRFGVDLAFALERKLAKNAARYPIARARGSNIKYTEL
jgi:NTP pyrophosphatase (non-canonical NTP hydrolase)